MKSRSWIVFFWLGFLVSTCGSLLVRALDAHSWPEWLGTEAISAAVSALATIVIAKFTVRLSDSTELLWGEARQASSTAEGGLRIATQSLELSRRSLEVTQRAFVFFTSLQPEILKQEKNGVESVNGYGFVAHFTNSGTTPATDVGISALSLEVPKGLVPNFVRPAISGRGVLGPGSGGQTPPQFFPVSTLSKAFAGKCDLWVWVRVTYRDVFNPDQLHHHEMCGQVMFVLDPIQVPAAGDPPYCKVFLTGDQNTTA